MLPQAHESDLSEREDEDRETSPNCEGGAEAEHVHLDNREEDEAGPTRATIAASSRGVSLLAASRLQTFVCTF